MLEITCLVRGEPQGTRRLSRFREVLDASVSVAAVLAAGAVSLGVALVLSSRAGVVLKAPGFLVVWAGATLVCAAMAGLSARRHARAYVVGAGLEADAFADRELCLVRRNKGGYELRLVPGMRGWLHGGRVPAPVEALVSGGPALVQLGTAARAELHLGATTFVVRVVDDAAAEWSVSRRLWRRIAAYLTAPALTGMAAALLFAGPPRGAISERDMRSAIPARATPWEAEKILRRQAQLQSHTLHRCFDPLPLSCQKPGFVGVGVSLTREGDIKARWIARSTYGTDCPVDDCMADVVSTWIFDALPEPMRVVLPVQVLRTGRPLVREAFWEDAGKTSKGLAALTGGP